MSDFLCMQPLQWPEAVGVLSIFASEARRVARQTGARARPHTRCPLRRVPRTWRRLPRS